MSGERIDLLHAGRGVAAVAVVFYHANIFAPMWRGFELGWWAVPFFFFLSGYLMMHLRRGDFDARGFLTARMLRIYPAYLPVGIAAAIAYSAIGHEFDWLATLTLIPGKTALLPAWTLQREVFFYALIAVLFWLDRPLTGLIAWAAIILLMVGQDIPDAAKVALGWENLFFVVGALARCAGVPHGRAPLILNKIGDASYAIYLVHLPVMGGLWRIGAAFPVMIAGGIAAGFTYHLWMERPMLAWIKHRSHPKASTSPASLPSRTPIQSSRPQPEPG